MLLRLTFVRVCLGCSCTRENSFVHRSLRMRLSRLLTSTSLICNTMHDEVRGRFSMALAATRASTLYELTLDRCTCLIRDSGGGDKMIQTTRDISSWLEPGCLFGSVEWRRDFQYMTHGYVRTCMRINQTSDIPSFKSQESFLHNFRLFKKFGLLAADKRPWSRFLRNLELINLYGYVYSSLDYV